MKWIEYSVDRVDQPSGYNKEENLPSRPTTFLYAKMIEGGGGYSVCLFYFFCADKY